MLLRILRRTYTPSTSFHIKMLEEDQEGGVATRTSTVKELEQLLGTDGVCLQAWIQVMLA